MFSKATTMKIAGSHGVKNEGECEERWCEKSGKNDMHIVY